MNSGFVNLPLSDVFDERSAAIVDAVGSEHLVLPGSPSIALDISALRHGARAALSEPGLHVQVELRRGLLIRT